MTLAGRIGDNGRMSGSAVTEPKGRATRARNEDARRRSLIGPTLQWVLIVLALLAVVGAVLWFSRDVRSDVASAYGAAADVVTRSVGVTAE